jgi:hypothetical protein
LSDRDEALTDLHDHLTSMIDREDGPQAGVREPTRPLSPSGLTFAVIEEPDLQRGDRVDITRHGRTERYVVREPRAHGATLDRLT